MNTNEKAQENNKQDTIAIKATAGHGVRAPGLL